MAFETLSLDRVLSKLKNHGKIVYQKLGPDPFLIL